eukprot:scaffold43364_cov108-Phaeocystis_antarctica.AAC.1
MNNVPRRPAAPSARPRRQRDWDRRGRADVAARAVAAERRQAAPTPVFHLRGDGRAARTAAPR